MLTGESFFCFSSTTGHGDRSQHGGGYPHYGRFPGRGWGEDETDGETGLYEDRHYGDRLQEQDAWEERHRTEASKDDDDFNECASFLF